MKDITTHTITNAYQYVRQWLGKIENIFLVIALPALIMFINLAPPAWGLDEQVHTARSYQVSSGNFYPDKIAEDQYGGIIPQSLQEVLDRGHIESNAVDRQQPYFDRQDIRDQDGLNAQLAKSIETPMVTYSFGPTAPYSPIVYVPSAVGMGVGRVLNLSVGNTIKLAKFTQALIFVAMAYAALRLLAKQKAKWVVLLIALLPATIFQAATINADAYTIGACLLFFAVIATFFQCKSALTRNQLLLLGGSTAMLAFTKPSYAIFMVLILLLPARLFVNGRRKLRVIAIVLAVAGLLFLLTSIKGLLFGNPTLVYQPPEIAAHVDMVEQVKWVVVHPLEFAGVLYHSTIVNASEWTQSLVGVLGYNTIRTPYPLLILSVVAMILAGLSLGVKERSFALWMIAGGVLSSLSVFVLLYGTFNTVGADFIQGVQGRYFIPCVPFILFGLSYLLPIRLQADRRFAGLFIAIAATTLYGTVFAYGSALY